MDVNRRIRAFYRFLLFVAVTLGLYLALLAGRVFVPNHVYWRQLIFSAWVNSFIRIARIRVEAIGKAPRPPFFLVANHVSYVDIAVLRTLAEGVFVAKAEVEDWPVAGRMCRDIGTIFIDRARPRDIPRAGREILDRIESGEGVIVFPEGGSGPGDRVLPFHSSFFEFASRADIPVSYAAVNYRTRSGDLPASRAVAWADEIGFVAHLWRLLGTHEVTATVNFGGETVRGADRKALADELHSRVSQSFIPLF